jgi:hypothetical protein
LNLMAAALALETPVALFLVLVAVIVGIAIVLEPPPDVHESGILSMLLIGMLGGTETLISPNEAVKFLKRLLALSNAKLAIPPIVVTLYEVPPAVIVILSGGKPVTGFPVLSMKYAAYVFSA